MLTDDSPMPEGPLKGTKMEKIPALYLLTIWDNNYWNKPESDVHKYIKSVLKSLQQDETDYILQHKPKK